MAPCPAHEDKNPSFQITATDKNILVYCFAGCPQDAVIGALKDRGLWPEASPLQKQAQQKRELSKKCRFYKTVLLIAEADKRNGVIWSESDKAQVEKARIFMEAHCNG